MAWQGRPGHHGRYVVGHEAPVEDADQAAASRRLGCSAGAGGRDRHGSARSEPVDDRGGGARGHRGGPAASRSGRPGAGRDGVLGTVRTGRGRGRAGTVRNLGRPQFQLYRAAGECARDALARRPAGGSPARPGPSRRRAGQRYRAWGSQAQASRSQDSRAQDNPRSGATGKVAAPQVAVGSLAGSAYEVMQPPPVPPAPPFANVTNWTVRGGPGPLIKLGPRGPFTPNPGWWRGRLLVPVALILLTLGLWLVPRTLAALRAWLATQDSALRPWTIAAVVAALSVVVKWPQVAADLVPLALAAFAVRGFALAASSQSLAPGGPGPLAGPPGTGVMYGALLVDSRPMALLAGVEASALLAFGAWLVPRTIVAHVRTLLDHEPDPDLVGRVRWLTETRGHAVDTATSELRRIERDLHDGAQARLVALGMNLRAVERMLPASPQAALALVAEARETSVRALNELRDLIRGIYPPVLADRGLGHAVQALALDTPLPTELDIDLPGRLTAPVESACYFAVAEALANAVKHSGARGVHIRIQHRSGTLRIEVADDGAGGADPAKGTGLQGVERRLGTFDGILAVSSPPGGPTMIVMEVPCALSSPKTCSC